MKVIDRLKLKTSIYESAKKRKDGEDELYKDRVFEVEKEFRDRETQLAKTYYEEKEKLEKAKQKAISAIPHNFSDKQGYETLEREIQEIVEANRIDHNLMCLLLEKKTGKAWSAKVVTGICKDWEYGAEMCRFGVVLMNEEHPRYNGLVASYSATENPYDEDNVILVRLGGCFPVSERPKYQERANTYNWFLTYLDAKGILPAYEDASQLANLKGYKNVVVSAIDDYLKAQEARNNNTPASTASEDEDALGR